jgi:hypothetical protein
MSDGYFAAEETGRIRTSAIQDFGFDAPKSIDHD